MAAAVKKGHPGLINTLKRFIFGPVEAPARAPLLLPPGPALPYTHGQQRELERLLDALLRKRALVASGRLQMLGFEKLRAKMGERWAEARVAVYQIANEVIRRNVSPGDIYVRYRDDSYILIFATATVDESAETTKRIASEIGRQVAAAGYISEGDMRVNAHVGETEAAKLAGLPLPEAVLVLHDAAREDAGARARAAQAAAATRAAAAAPKAPNCTYAPLWDLKIHALSAYLCALAGNESLSALERDLDTLRAAKAELQRMQDAKAAFTLVVPVRHATLFNPESGQKYQMIYRDIPEAQKKNLVFLITQYMDGLPENTAYWFVPALRTACRQVLAEMPLRGKSSLQALKSRGLDGFCVTVEQQMDEAVTLGHLRSFSDQCREAGFGQIVALGLPSLSLATSVSCMGFTAMGGAAIHAPASAPDKAHRFRYAEIFSGTR